ncbi:Bcyfh7 [Apiospora marii]|uniref:Bcyfh7 n=1 Tax=Apiospora marii TaxID=335849 RepID=A0ABR1SVK9_9PEZI
MEEQVTRLVDKAWEGFQNTPEDRRYLIAIAGIPGSGKTTLSQIVADRLNARHATLHPELVESVPVAAFVPMDGYHLTRAQLSSMPDPEQAHARRGAEFTFDGPAYLRLIQDPKENDITILPGHRIVVFEGNYLTLDREPWREAAGLMDQRWFVEVDFAVARRRLVKRHVAAGIAADEAEAGKRADENDLVNGEQIMRERVSTVDEIVVSREDGDWRVQK